MVEDKPGARFRPLPGCGTLGQPLAFSESWVWPLSGMAQPQPPVTGHPFPAWPWAKPFLHVVSANSLLDL